MMLTLRYMSLLLLAMLAPAAHSTEQAALRPAGLSRSLAVKNQGYSPVALRLRDGRIAVVLRGGAGHLEIQGRLDIIFSGDGGRTWTSPVVVVDSPVDDRNPALGQARDRTLVVGFCPIRQPW
jgi:hypothetical protein